MWDIMLNMTLMVCIKPFDWWRFEVGGPWQGSEAIWIIIGPLDIGAHWSA